MISISKIAYRTAVKLSHIIDIKEDDLPIYAFGLEMFFNAIITLFLLAIMGLIYNQLLESIVYGIFFSILRVYAGGFHFKSESICFWFSLIIDLIAVILIHRVKWNSLFFLPVSILSLSLLFLSPVETPEKKLFEEEKVAYKKRTHTLVFIYFSLLLLSSYFNLNSVSMAISLSLSYVSLLVLVGYILNILGDNKNT